MKRCNIKNQNVKQVRAIDFILILHFIVIAMFHRLTTVIVWEYLGQNISFLFLFWFVFAKVRGYLSVSSDWQLKPRTVSCVANCQSDDADRLTVTRQQKWAPFFFFLVNFYQFKYFSFSKTIEQYGLISRKYCLFFSFAGFQRTPVENELKNA